MTRNQLSFKRYLKNLKKTDRQLLHEYFGDTVPLVSGHIVPLSMSDISG